MRYHQNRTKVMSPISIVTKRMGMVGEQKIDHVTRIKPAMDAASSMLRLALRR